MLTELFRRTRAAPPTEPLDHPVLRAMSLRELADLPIPRPAPTASGRAFTTGPVRVTPGE